MSLTPIGSIENIFTQALHLEKEGDVKGSVSLYEKALKASPGDEKILTRLMILSRKLKDKKTELKYIELLIKTHLDYYKPRKKKDSTIEALSKKLNISLGRTDKKGNALIVPDAVKKLEKRKENLLKKK